MKVPNKRVLKDALASSFDPSGRLKDGRNTTGIAWSQVHTPAPVDHVA